MTEKQATFGAGCFWCIEAIFIQLKGVKEVKPGFAGGHIKNPAYREVCEGRTGHAEVIRIVFDADVISYSELLEIFWYVHNPTTLNRQGNDVGSQYRSVIFYHDEEQRDLAEAYKKKLDSIGAYDDPVVSEIKPLTTYFDAESDHKDYYERNPEQGYCLAVVRPKVEKFKAAFSEMLK
ncbi:peptide-methionine (S)-S-oxide reductase [Brumimicrobium glaciale]|uniref:Peptide methionine sulfoxide reductase MsrA n=1 Tax=Brumimicrobium glaciale TaxID=200475 RepID=A0A4Q4KRQ0_9FLAO|nr:peptide-methionine (S)-S-oxide reductase MsrA [Brumimicrobium glaciale]RYM36107.1 peptide-methionine (S)-S-oxide reductase [Brumimicrobium glaciale]